jgi:uncharacterized Zn finger protein
MSFWSYYPPRVTAAQRRAKIARTLTTASKRGQRMSPIVIKGRKIAETFWGKAWCDNLERYRDFAHRLERGRTYVRNGSVVDLTVGAGSIDATVCGTELYKIAISIDALDAKTWSVIQTDCAGSIGSRVDLLAGKLSDSVMTRLCADRIGLFPPPSAIRFSCSCPDYAIMCKHVAAAMYGVGARLDHAPELLFELRKVSLDDLVSSAIAPTKRAAPKHALAADGLAAMFGIDIADSFIPEAPITQSATKPRKPRKPRKPPKPRKPATRRKR